MSKTETTTKEVEIEKNEADEVDFGFDSVSEKPSKIKQAGEWAKYLVTGTTIFEKMIIGGIAVMGVASVLATTAVLKSMVNHIKNKSDDHNALEDDTYVEVNATENETSEE